MLGIAIGPNVHAVVKFLRPYVTATLDAIADRLCPLVPTKAHVPTLAETFDDMDAVTAAEALANLRSRRRPEWVPPSPNEPNDAPVAPVEREPQDGEAQVPATEDAHDD